jgi:hypothetical protein
LAILITCALVSAGAAVAGALAAGLPAAPGAGDAPAVAAGLLGAAAAAFDAVPEPALLLGVEVLDGDAEEGAGALAGTESDLEVNVAPACSFL